MHQMWTKASWLTGIQTTLKPQTQSCSYFRYEKVTWSKYTNTALFSCNMVRHLNTTLCNKEHNFIENSGQIMTSDDTAACYTLLEAPCSLSYLYPHSSLQNHFRASEKLKKLWVNNSFWIVYIFMQYATRWCYA